MDRAAALVADRAEFIIVPLGLRYRGPKGYVQYARSWIDAFSNCSIAVGNWIDAKEWAIAEFTLTGTHDGPLQIETRSVIGTGQKIELHGCDLLKTARGKIVMARSYFDIGSIWRVLGKNEKNAPR